MRQKLKPIHLVLFFTRGVSLHTWGQNGSLEREIALYLRLQQQGVKISFVTYGDKTDLKYKDALQGIEILCNRWNLPRQIYEYLLPLLHAPVLFRASLIKTNQMKGAEIALRAARLWRKPLLVRCGYMWSDLMQSGGKTHEAERARKIEQVVFAAARHVIVTTPSMKEYAARNYGISGQGISVVPNFVLTDIFSPAAAVQPIPNRVCFIGRLSDEKNLFALVQACAGLDVDLHFIGSGHLHSALQEKARELGTQLTLHENLPHHRLPDMLRQSALFVLVSPHEGHPKSLLEAMSCGVAALGADSPGIREQIKHGETGWLCGMDAQSIRAGIQHLLDDPLLREELGRNARRFIEENYSLDKIVELEYSLIKEFTGI